MKPKLTNRQKQAIQTKNRIFDVTIALSTQKGYPNINIEEICRAADVSVGTFYNYYKSKNEVFYELYSRADLHFMDNVDADSLEGSPGGVLDFFRHYTAYCEQTGVQTLTQMMNAENKNFNKKNRYLQVLLTMIFQKGLSGGTIHSEKSAAELCELYFIVARGVLFDWCLNDGEYDLSEKMIEILSLVNI